VDAPADDARAPDAQAARPEEGTGAWDVSISTSSLDDSTTVVLSLDSDTVLAKRFGGFDTPRMILRCKENTTSFYIVVAGHHLTDIQSYGRITYRLDQQPAATLDALASTDSKALGLWTGRSAIPFIKSLANARKLVARVTPYSESPKEFTFDLTGLSQALVPLRQSCKW
jgi:type VI secretion system protein VasI